MPTVREIFSSLMHLDFSLPANRLTRSRAIRYKCVDCTAGQQTEIRECAIKTCPLWPYRMGRSLKEHELEGGSGELEGGSGELEGGSGELG